MISVLFRFYRSMRWVSATRVGQAVLLFIALLAYSSSGYMYFELPDNPGLAWADAVWWSLVTMTTVGYGDYFPSSLGGRVFVGVPAMILGVGLLGYMLSLFATAMIESRLRKARGMTKIGDVNHIIICNFGRLSRTLEVVQEIRKDPSTARCCIVLVDVGLGELPEELVDQKVSFVRGDPARAPVLEQANIVEARAVIIQADQADPAHADNRTLHIALTIEALAPTVFTIAECRDPDNEIYLRRAGCESVVCITALSGQMIVQELQDPGVSSIVAELTSNMHGKQFYVVDIRSSCTKYAEVRQLYLGESMYPLGIRRGQENFLLPANEFAVEAGDRVILVAGTRPD